MAENFHVSSMHELKKPHPILHKTVSAADLAAVCESWLVIMFDLRLIAFLE